MFDINSTLYQVCNWISRFAYVNFLWLSFTAIGLVLFGFFPATVATFTIVRKWVLGKQEEISIFKLFVNTYRKEFFSSNLVGLILVIAGIILYVDFKIMSNLDGILASVMTFFFIGISIIFAIMVLYIFPVYVHYEAGIIQYFKNACIIGILHPIKTILMMLTVLLTVFISTTFPILILFFTISIFAYLLMRVSVGAFHKVGEKHEEEPKDAVVN